ncbi:hypothetical protein [Acinetobacter sp. NCu2D-2]|uniref:hypothetical protein n=1 Tax=Acinetobacter sp. NCu2D-2 TaxID=1608473 RepID=UPI001D0D2EBE|nr:hypothetical protein [Acinetobacter sp. NCu2D-2]
MYPTNLHLNYWMIGLSWIIGIFFMHFVILHLPIFKDFYINRKKLKNIVVQTRKYNHAEHKAAPVMSGTVVFVIACTTLYFLNLTQHYVEYAFITALSTGNMSYYYTP